MSQERLTSLAIISINHTIAEHISYDDLIHDFASRKIPKCLQLPSVTKGLVSYADSQNYSHYKKAAHVFIWAPWEGQSVFGEYRAAVMMQMRFDGTFGFSGGIIEEGEDLIEGLNREIEEEIVWDSIKHKITLVDYYNTQVNQGKQLVFHLFIKEIPFEDFVELEKRCLTSKDFGSEVLGCTRVPLYTLENNYGGLPAFLNNRFVGGAKQQLLLALHHSKILSEVEIEEVMYKSQNMKLAASRF